MSAATVSSVPIPSRGWRNDMVAALFWLLTVVGVLMMTGAWFLLALASLEEGTEQPKALAAGTTMAGTTLWLGIVPLVFAHIAGFALCLVATTGRFDRARGVLWAGEAVIGASLIGLAVVLVLSGGQLLYTPPDYVP
ncbi:hypothetical protein [Microbacterium sp. Clip185]|uniref:hypothetical protein n=1 Tax=Microbacterium sp. Clip185 TaxID=3025663 RepID=UPI002365AC76|nr:hypothetical protein [Microbacterium sp. Clip185]WDG17279.1 hypothetical protein PQV94_11665 [Microbacterium sp. Clip185]